MPLPAIVAALGIAIGNALLTATAEQTVSAAFTRAKERLSRRLQQGKYAEIQRALQRACSDVLAQYTADAQRERVRQVLDTCIEARSGPLLDEFSAQVTQIYLLPRGEPPALDTLARLYRKMSSPVAHLRGEVPDDATLTAIFHAFFVAFREHLLQEKEFAHLRDYDQLLAVRQQTILQQEIVEQLDAIRANTAHPVEDIARRRHEYLAYLVNDLKDHTLRGFAPQVGGRVLSVPLAQVFLPLEAIEGPPALATYAADDLRHQTEIELGSELDQQRHHAEMERRHAQLSARLAAQRRLSLSDLLRESRVVLLGDPGSGKTTMTRYIAYALAADDSRHIGVTTFFQGKSPLRTNEPF